MFALTTTLRRSPALGVGLIGATLGIAFGMALGVVLATWPDAPQVQPRAATSVSETVAAPDFVHPDKRDVVEPYPDFGLRRISGAAAVEPYPDLGLRQAQAIALTDTFAELQRHVIRENAATSAPAPPDVFEQLRQQRSREYGGE